jgi:phosphatidylglycerol:prolipoprotein diacylglycerol transferase
MFVHRLDPIFAQLGGVYFWWYGLSYTLGFLELHLWFRWNRARLGLTLRDVVDLTILIASSVVLGGRLVEVVFYEWPFYSAHPSLIPAVWIGGMATHGLLLGAAFGTWFFCRTHGKDFVTIADALVIPGAFLMGVGRIGNFIDGQIVGSVTTMPWGVNFPDAPGFRHPVVLYDGIKNLLLIPLLLAIRKRNPKCGMLLGHFIFWYAFLRIFVDVFREYPTRMFGLATGQGLNITMTLIGVALLVWFGSRKGARTESGRQADSVPIEKPVGAVRWVLLGLILVFCATMPSDWTQDVPARYAKRHPGLRHSALYPPVQN